MLPPLSYSPPNVVLKDGLKAKKRAKLRRRKKLKEFILSSKSGPCADCGGVFPVECMDFDHIGSKSFTVSMAKDLCINRVAEEIKKCELVCANCHRVRTKARGYRN